MSDPVTNVEIEDVLESIRLLIAAEDPAVPASPRRGPQRQDRLVLTPALRVDTCTAHRHHDDAARLATAEGARTEAQQHPTAPGPEDSAHRPADPVPPDAPDHDTVPDTASAPADDTTVDHGPWADSEAGGDAGHALQASARPLAPTLTLQPSDRTHTPPTARARDREDVGDDHAEPARARWAPAPDGADEPSPPAMHPAFDDTEQEETTALWHSSRHVRDPLQGPAPDTATSPDDVMERHPAASGQDDGRDPARQSTRRSSLEATIAELEAAVTFSAQDFEADEPETGLARQMSGRLHLVVTGDLDPPDAEVPRDPPPTTAEPPAQEDRPADPPQDDAPPRSGTVPRFRVYPGSAPPRDPEQKPSAKDSQVAARPDLDDDADLAAYLDDDSVIDEEALRDLVGQIVREELQGVLGERITRNVRKLVRREIHRILSSQDFD